MLVERVGWEFWRKEMKRWVWARARAEARVPMRRVCGCCGVDGEFCWVDMAGGGSVEDIVRWGCDLRV